MFENFVSHSYLAALLNEHLVSLSARRNRVPLEIIVLDVNDHPPRCLRPLHRLTVTENTARLTPPARVEATDADQPGTVAENSTWLSPPAGIEATDADQLGTG